MACSAGARLNDWGRLQRTQGETVARPPLGGQGGATEKGEICVEKALDSNSFHENPLRKLAGNSLRGAGNCHRNARLPFSWRRRRDDPPAFFDKRRKPRADSPGSRQGSAGDVRRPVRRRPLAFREPRDAEQRAPVQTEVIKRAASA